MEIIPAILPKDYTELTEKIDLVKDFVDTVQIDICDGQFTQTATWPYKKNDTHFEAMRKEGEGLPGWETLDFEIHLMVRNPEEIIEDWITAGAKRIIIHPKSTNKIEECMSLMQGIVEIGFAFEIADEIEIIDGVDFIQLMGIAHIGEQGQEFDATVIDRISEAKEKYPEIPVSIDGAVSLDTVSQLAGADRFVIGSAIFENENIPQVIEEFHSIIGA